MKKKKVAVLLMTEPQNGGSHQYAMTIVKCLKELSESHFDLLALCMNGFWCRWCNQNHVKFLRVNYFRSSLEQIRRNIKFPIYSRLHNIYAEEFGKTIRKEKVDILFYTEQTIYIPNLNVKTITPVHDLMHRYESNFPEVKEDFQRRELVFKCQAKYTDYILTDSLLGKEQFRESYMKINQKKPHVVSLPFIVSNYITEINEKPVDGGVPDKYVFYPAQFWKHKNHINLIKAIQILKKDIDDIHLILVGSEKNCCEEVKKYISQNDLERYITILGFVSDENMVYLYRHAMGMIMPSYFGPTNIPPLEAMALGCPVAVSNKYAMPEQVGKAGLLFSPDSPEEIAGCIRQLWLDDKMREEMIKRGYQRADRWTQKEFKYKLLRIVKRCML